MLSRGKLKSNILIFDNINDNFSRIVVKNEKSGKRKEKGIWFWR